MEEILSLIFLGFGLEDFSPAKFRRVAHEHPWLGLDKWRGLYLDPLDLPVVDQCGRARLMPVLDLEVVVAGGSVS